MKKRAAVRLVSFCLAAVLAAAGFCLKAVKRQQYYRLQISNTYSRSLDDLGSAINNISLLLRKAEYVTGAKQISEMSAELYSEAEIAKTALSLLPTGGGELASVNRFLSQVGNYALSVSKTVITGGNTDSSHQTNLELLNSAAEKISETVGGSQITYNNLDYWASELDSKLTSSEDATLSQSLESLEENLSDYPTLIYDGPYSDHILTKKPLMLEGVQDITRDEALEAAAKLLSVSEKTLSYDGLDNGKIPAYRFSGGGATVCISRAGGYTVYMRKEHAQGDTALNYSQMLEKAKRFIARSDRLNLIDTYYYTDEGVCVINFAHLDGETICYTDLVKVGVATDTGEIVLLEFSGYLVNHTSRAFESVQYTPEQAAEAVSPNLTVRETSLALIPTDGGGEVRCYELLCSGRGGEEILIYLNAVTLDEEEIFILLKSDGGTLVK